MISQADAEILANTFQSDGLAAASMAKTVLLDFRRQFTVDYRSTFGQGLPVARNAASDLFRARVGFLQQVLTVALSQEDKTISINYIAGSATDTPSYFRQFDPNVLRAAVEATIRKLVPDYRFIAPQVGDHAETGLLRGSVSSVQRDGKKARVVGISSQGGVCTGGPCRDLTFDGSVASVARQGDPIAVYYLGTVGGK